MSIDFENKTEVTTTLKNLVKEVQGESCSSTTYETLSEIMKTIGQDNKLYEEYKDLYEEIEDELMLAGANLEKCGCDPLKRQTPGG